MPSNPRPAGHLTLGRIRVPVIVAALIGGTALASIAGAVGARNGLPDLLRLGLLIVPDTWRGQAWRLVTWVLFEREPLALVFACLTLYWFGGAMARRWGARRLLAFYAGVAAAAGAITCIVALAWPGVALIPFGGSWPVLDGLMVAWGLLHRDAQLRFFGVLPLRGRHLVWLTLAGTALYALFYGAAPFVPHFAAELLVLLWLGLIPGARTARLRVRAQSWSFDKWLERERRR